MLTRLITGFSKLGWLLGFMFPPAAHGWFLDFCQGIFQTLGMAFLGTLFAALIALPFGFLGARNVVSNFVIHFSLRRSFDCLRGIDTLIWALVFVHVVGLGPFAGILAIIVSDMGSFAKLFSEAIENIDRKQVDGVRAAGASEIEVIRFGILPQVIPIILSQALYYFESNTRSATILGIVGAGGIGLQLSDRIRVNNWDEACLIIIMILITVSLIDYLSRMIRLEHYSDRGIPPLSPNSRGYLVLVVGPSGAGKDSILDGARTELADDPRFLLRAARDHPARGCGWRGPPTGFLGPVPRASGRRQLRARLGGAWLRLWRAGVGAP